MGAILSLRRVSGSVVLRVSGSVGSVGSVALSVPSVLDRLDSPGASGSLLGGRFSDTPRHFVTSQSHFQIAGGRRHGGEALKIITN